METILEQLKETSGTNDKCAILKGIKDKDILRCFQLTYDPFIRFYINKIEPQMGSNHLTFKGSVKEFYQLCDKLSTRQITGNEARAAVELFLSKCSASVQDAYIKILKKDLKVGVTDTLMNKVYGDDFIETFSVQLSNKYLEKLTSKDVKNVKFYWASPKLDGLRCYYKNGMLLTRNGHEIFGFEHIIEELGRIDCDFLDGELYSTEVKFQKIQGDVLRQKNIDPEKKKKIFFNIFAMGRKEFKNTTDMVEYLREVKDEQSSEYVRFVPYTKVDNTIEAITALCEKFMSQGYEGIMLRHPEKWYEWKRSNALLKYKLFREEDFKVVGFYLGDKGTKYEKILGGITIEGPVATVEGGTTIVNIHSDCGSGFDDEDRVEIWNNQKDYLGLMAEIKFQNLTDDLTSIRFPIFKAFKLDR